MQKTEQGDNKPLSSLELEQMLSDEQSLLTLVSQKNIEAQGTLISRLIDGISRDPVKEAALLSDLFNLTAREGTGEATNRADAAMAIFWHPNMRSLFMRQQNLLLEKYLESVRGQSKEDDVWSGSIARLISLGEHCAPFFKRDIENVGKLNSAWGQLIEQFTNHEQRVHMIAGVERIIAIALQPKRSTASKKNTNESSPAKTEEEIWEENRGFDQQVLDEIKKNPEMTYIRIAIRIMGVSRGRFGEAVSRLTKQGLLENRTPGIRISADRQKKYDEVLDAIRANPHMPYEKIGRDILHLEPQEMQLYVTSLRHLDKLQDMPKRKRGPQPKKTE